jgi:heterodisulfide reductase subunit A-like polyferredoxin
MTHRPPRLLGRLLPVLACALFLTACLHTVQETTCKSKFKKKYHCPFKKITVVEDELDMGDTLKLRGCGKTVTYDGTEEVLVE